MSTIEKAMRKLGATEGESTAMPSPIPAESAGAGACGDAAHEPVTATASQPDEAVKQAIPGVHEPRHREEGARGAGTSLDINLPRLRDLGFIAPGDPTTPLSEEFQEIKRKLIANMIPGANAGNAPPNLIMVTSSVPGEGKTFTSMNLALSLAQEIDRTVLAVDIDILKSDLSRLFGAYNRTGLYDYLAHPDLDVSDVIMRTNVPSLAFIPAGTIRKGITERLASQAMFNLTRELAARYPDRIIIFDAPPVLATTGAAALGPMVGQVVLVVEAYSSTQENLSASLNALERAHIAGIVLNKIRHRAAGRGYGDGYGYGYGYGYGQARPETERQRAG